MQNPFENSRANSFNSSGPPLSQDPRYSAAKNFRVSETPTFFNGKKIALELLQERDSLISLIDEFSLLELSEIRQHIQKAVSARDLWIQDINSLQAESNRLRSDIGEANAAIEVQSFGIYDYDHIAKDSVALSDELAQIRSLIKEEIRLKRAATATSGFSFNGSQAEGKKFLDSMTKLMLRAYNAEAENAVKSVKSDNSSAAINRLDKCKEQTEKLGSMINLKISNKYHNARRREIELAFEYFRVLRIEKEKAKDAADQLREEKRAEMELKKRQEDLSRELQQKQIALARLTELQAQSLVVSEDDRLKLQALQDEIGDIGTALEQAEERAANLKAGYVYVISNIGALGESSVKIGMTRRVDPMDRVKELGSASVPFTFDVHLIHYSENALSIEKELHRIFASKRVNLANPRKEHFYATPAEVKKEIMKLDGSITTFKEDVDAQEYYESLKMRKAIEASTSGNLPTRRH